MWLNEKSKRGQDGSETWSMGLWKVTRRRGQGLGILHLGLQNPAWEEKGVQWIILQPESPTESWLILTQFPSCILPLLYFAWISAHSKPAESLCLWGCHLKFFLISLSFRHRSLAIHLERFPAGSEDRLYLCSLAQSLSAFEQILYPPARRGWWHNNLCEPIFLLLLQ